MLRFRMEQDFHISTTSFHVSYHEDAVLQDSATNPMITDMRKLAEGRVIQAMSSVPAIPHAIQRTLSGVQPLHSSIVASSNFLASLDNSMVGARAIRSQHSAVNEAWKLGTDNLRVYCTTPKP